MSETHALLDRIHRLERRLRFIVTAGALTLVALGTMAQIVPIPQMMTGRSFSLVDDSNAVRARLEVVGGQPNLTFLDADGRVAARLGIGTEEGGVLEVLDSDGNIARFPTRAGVRPLTEGRW